MSHIIERLLAAVVERLTNYVKHRDEAALLAHDVGIPTHVIRLEREMAVACRDLVQTARRRRALAKLGEICATRYQSAVLDDAFAAALAQITPSIDAGGVLTTGTLPPKSDPSPAQLLDARYEVVPWHAQGRDAIVAKLDAWADAPDFSSVWLLHAEGGIGKTRLAIEWCRRLRTRDVAWCAGLLPKAAPERWAEDLCSAGAPVLVVIDYAESRPELSALLTALREAHNQSVGVKLRVLLLARNDGDWWSTLTSCEPHGAWLSARTPEELTPVAVSAAARRAVFDEAATRYRAVRRFDGDARPPSLDDARFGRVLYLHMAALAAVEGLPVDAQSLMETVLDHEERFWEQRAEPRGGDRGFSRHMKVARWMVAGATLRGGLESEEEAEALHARFLGRVLVEDDEEVRHLLHRVYERSGEATWQPALEPDLVGEAMVRRVAAPKLKEHAAPDAWIERVFPTPVDTQWGTGFTVLGRASEHAPETMGRWVARLLVRGEIEAVAPIALEAARVVGKRTAFGVLGPEIVRALEERGDARVAAALERVGVPWETVSLREVAAWVARTAHHSAGHDEPALVERARRANHLGKRLGDLGRWEEALEATREAVDIRRMLSARTPDAFLPDLAASLNNQGAVLSALGQREEALKVTWEAVDIRRMLGTRNPDAFLPDLAISLNNLGAWLGDLGQREGALKATREAVYIHRTLSARTPDAFLPDLARSLNNLGIRLSALGQQEEAKGAMREAVDIRRTLSARTPDAFLPDLAMSLNNLGNVLGALGQLEEALKVTREAVEINRMLSARTPDAFLPDLAISLNNLGAGLSALGQREEALVATREAVEIYRMLSAQTPDAFTQNLAASLDNLGTMLSALGQREEALAATREAVEIYRTLSMRNLDAFLADFARGLNNLGNVLGALGQFEEALKATREAADIRRALSARIPDAFLPDLAMSLNNLGNVLGALAQREEAMKVTLEAIDIYHTLSARNPDTFLPDLVRSHGVLGRVHFGFGDVLSAAEAFVLSAEMLEPLRQQHPGAYNALASALRGWAADAFLCLGDKAPPDLVARLRALPPLG